MTYSGIFGDIILSGTIKHFATSTSTNANITHLLSLNLPSILSYNNAFKSKTTIVSTIPELPSELTDGSYMFSSCSGLTGGIHELPETLTDVGQMFPGCSGLSGTAPSLPPLIDKYTCGDDMWGACYVTFFKTLITNDNDYWPVEAW